MNRRDFLAVGTGAAAGGILPRRRTDPDGDRSDRLSRSARTTATPQLQPGPQVRELFPRLADEAFLNAAGGTPLGAFAHRALREYEEFWRLGSGEGRGSAVDAMLSGVREGLAALLGAGADEIAFVASTKAGEQIVLDGLPALRRGGNVVTNDLHFAGSLHNLVGLRRAGVDVRIVRAVDWAVTAEAMEEAIDDQTALVAVTLLSNVNGHVEAFPRLAEVAHRRGAYVYADVIQAAGIVPFDVRELGIDFAAGNGYKWLFGPHGTGFLYVRHELQGSVLEDRLFPGSAQHNYEPWVETVDGEQGALAYRPPTDATRYQPGHVSYLGYAAVHAGLQLLESIGIDTARRHSVELGRRLYAAVDPARYPCISPHRDDSPIISFRVPDPAVLAERLAAARVVVAFAGNRLRVSPALFNDETDIDRLAAVLDEA